MTQEYNPQKVEAEVQNYWEQHNYFVSKETDKEKFYCLSMFPYPSGNLHVGHVRNYTLSDVIARFMVMQGKNVLHPIGWDAFGLPAENAAIKNKVSPAKWTYANTKNMKKQLKALGLSFDWSKELATCHPEYYRWEQWLFIKMYEQGLAYKKNAIVNWDPVDNTVLANEQVIDGRGWRSGALVEKREISQWFLKITDYADRLLNDLEELQGWPEQVRTMQKNWIGKSFGTNIKFQIDANLAELSVLEVYTTRADTAFGITYLSVAPEHPLAKHAAANNPAIATFIKESSTIKVAEAELATMEKKGIYSGFDAISPLTGEKIPVWIANYVIMSYGSGAVMAVPAHDIRDFEFAQKYNLPIKQVIAAQDVDTNIDLTKEAFIDYGVLINSGKFDGLSSTQAKQAITKELAQHNQGSSKTNFRLRDWGISRQRYWGAPIPMVNCKTCGTVPVAEQDLPIKLPEEVDFTGATSPLADMPEFINTTCPKCQKSAQRETDTFDTFMESSWYYLRYPCVDQTKSMVDARTHYWENVDQYIGGIEHAVLHLLYARFLHKVLNDLGLVKTKEPFKNLLTQGMVLKDGHKMSKSKGNTVDPQELIDSYGADTLRLFILFTAPPEQSLEWSEAGVEGANKFLKRLWRSCIEHKAQMQAQGFAIINKNYTFNNLTANQQALRLKTHTTLQKVTDDISRRYTFNTAIAALMELSNAVNKFDCNDEQDCIVKLEAINIMLQTLNPIVPHITHKLWNEFAYTDDIAKSWPTVDKQATVTDAVEVVIQINGKLRARVTMSKDLSKEQALELAMQQSNIAERIVDKPILKTIVVPNKLINIVIGA